MKKKLFLLLLILIVMFCVLKQISAWQTEKYFFISLDSFYSNVIKYAKENGELPRTVADVRGEYPIKIADYLGNDIVSGVIYVDLRKKILERNDLSVGKNENLPFIHYRKKNCFVSDDRIGKWRLDFSLSISNLKCNNY